MSRDKRILPAALAAFCMISMLMITVTSFPIAAHAASGYEFIALGAYSKTMQVGDEFYLIAVASNGKKPGFSSSDSSVASVNTYGKITAKKSGSAVITAKIKNGEASCRVKVKKTSIRLSAEKLSVNCGESKQLSAKSSTGHPVKFKSSKSSIASIDENGRILAKKPGSATITATCDKTSVKCAVTVRRPLVALSRSRVCLYRKETVRLSVSTSSKHVPKWKTSKKSVATVGQDGTVTAVKNGEAVITVTIDGVSKTCVATVKKPTIRFETDCVTLDIGETHQAAARVSSKNKPSYSSSNAKIATVDQNGTIRAKAAGKAYIYAKEDGAKERMTVIVSAPGQKARTR